MDAKSPTESHVVFAPLPGSSEGVYWSPDHARVAIVVCGGSVRIAPSEEPGVTGHTLQPHVGTLHQVTWSPDGAVLCTGGSDGLSLWCVGTGEEICTVAYRSTVVFHTAELTWSADSARLAVYHPFDGEFVLNAGTGALCESKGVPPHPYTRRRHHVVLTSPQHVIISCTALSVSPDGRRVALECSNGSIRVGTVGTVGAVGIAGTYAITVTHVSGDLGGGHTASWSPNGLKLATASDDTVRVWDVGTMLLLGFTTPANLHTCVRLSWSPDGRQVALDSRDHFARTVDVSTLRSRTEVFLTRVTEAATAYHGGAEGRGALHKACLHPLIDVTAVCETLQRMLMNVGSPQTLSRWNNL